MTGRRSSLPNIFKGIVLFTPGGDLIYGIDPSKQAQWHIHLCLGLQKIWDLSDPPHFLIPGYTATVERWLDPQTQQVKVIAEAHPPVQSYIPLLRVLFDLEATIDWQIAPWQEEYCSRAVIETYRHQFPQLWEERDLVIRLDPRHSQQSAIIGADSGQQTLNSTSDVSIATNEQTGGYILRLFISSDHLSAEQTLGNIHQILEQGLTSPYTLKVIDLSKNPEQAEIHQVAATPTLVRVWPQPVRLIVGQLDDIQRVLQIISSF